MSIFSRGGNLAISGFWSKFDYRPALGNLRGNQIYQNIFACMNWSDVFTILFHEFLPRIFQSLNSWKRYTNFFGSFVSPIFFFSSPAEKKSYQTFIKKKFVDSEFKIGQAIWWIQYMSTKLSWNPKIPWI